MIHTYNEYHLGDQLVHLNYLREVCKQNPGIEFTHHCNPQHHDQLKPLCEGLQLHLDNLSIPPGSVNSWIGRENFFYNHPLAKDWVAFHLAWFDHLSDLLEVSNPLACIEDFLFDYPELAKPFYNDFEFDYLLINSPPNSGQLPDFNPQYFVNRAKELADQGLKVITTHPTGVTLCTLDERFTVTDIGRLSIHCKHIEGVATGPMWTTFNIFNQNKVLSRTFYCAHQTVNLTSNTVTKHKLQEN